MNRRAFIAAAALAAALLGGEAASAAPADDALNEANRLFEAQKYEEAARAYQELLKGEIDAATRGKAVFNLAVTLQQLGRHDEAIRTYQQMFDIPVDDREPGGHIMEAYRNYRPRAIWGIADCHFAKRDYAAALAAYQKAEKDYPQQSWCGTCLASFRLQYPFAQGLCRDWMGDTLGALKDYYRAAFPPSFLAEPDFRVCARIIDIYESAGKVDVLARLLDEIDAHAVRTWERKAGRDRVDADPERLKENLPTRRAREVLEVRRLCLDKQWDRLVAMLKVWSSVAPPREAGSRRANWKAAETARLLARAPDATVPLLAARLKTVEGNDTRWVIYALGLCGTEEAIAAVQTRLDDPYMPRDVIHALSLAGEAGRKAIDRLEAAGAAPDAIAAYRSGEMARQAAERQFPPVPGNVRVAERLAELDDLAAYQESLPKSVTMDLSTPRAAVQTLLTAVLIGDEASFMKCTDGAAEWPGIYEDLGGRAPLPVKYQVGEPRYPSSGRAEVAVTLEAEKRTLALVFLLAKRDENWVATGVRE